MRILAVSLALLFVATPAVAHIGMQTPTPRFNNGQNKWCPCGTAGDGTSGPGNQPNNGCELSASDPVRNEDAITTYDAGETIEVLWNETIGHTGRMRIAFDPDGADQSDFDANILFDVADPPGSNGNTGDANAWIANVTLPNTPCTNCTLQLIQVMNGDDDNPVIDVFNTDTYFQCADLILLAAEGEGEGGEGEGGEGEGGEGEGEGGEGEGDGGGEGDAGGDDDDVPPSCSAAPIDAPALALVALVACIRTRARRRR